MRLFEVRKEPTGGRQGRRQAGREGERFRKAMGRLIEYNKCETVIMRPTILNVN